MKYVLLFCETRETRHEWEAMPEDVRNEAYGRIYKWFEDNGAVFRGGNELQAPETATTVRKNGSGDPIVTDGPFIEGNEVIGGYAEVEVADLDEALRMAKTWPGRGTVEIRPVVEVAGLPDTGAATGGSTEATVAKGAVTRGAN